MCKRSRQSKAVPLCGGASRPCGFSLIEVLLALSILVASVIALSQLASIGSFHLNRSQTITDIQVLCQNKMNELIVGMKAP